MRDNDVLCAVFERHAAVVHGFGFTRQACVSARICCFVTLSDKSISENKWSHKLKMFMMVLGPFSPYDDSWEEISDS